MKVAVLGSGVIGVTTAYYLALAGHEVTVVDRQPGPALETSFGNAGEISPGYASPWAAPDIPLKALKWLFMRYSPLILRPKPDPRMIEWMVSILRNCTSARYARNKSRMMRLAGYSREVLIRLRADTGIQYDQRMRGTLQLFRTQHQLDGMAKDVAVLRTDGVPFEILDRQGCITAEPGLAFA
ncbi:MAG TPA: FAD-dependent oxidoreductase, partial [Rhizomicrobium sp.]|nr:FAD-dependent oxidoreductase [Rhizomicrobium sp.]